ncbi:DUF2493 domain-containing protein [Streptomyces sp. NPDC096153]|uniref:DUF2493 domain-containing protein n=1 Tax=Streptomyces sp. NPDC096153 TaxID=3155548 RepID=UPI0033230E00
MTYRILVTGSRDWPDRQAIWQALAEIVRELPLGCEIVIVHGDCLTGADRQADDWALSFGARVERHRAETFGPWPACGPRRNAHMVGLGADICLAFIGPCTSPRCRRPRPHDSHGTSGCAALAEQAGIPVRRYTP